MKAKPILGHKIIVEGPPLNLSAQVWRCECGQWEGKVPEVGPYGSTSSKARIAQIEMAHGKHARSAQAKAVKAAKATK